MSESGFFVVAPFCSCPVSLVSRILFAVVPGCAKCFFCCAPLGAATFQRGQRKKNTTQGVCFFLLWPRAGAQRGFSFPCLSPGPEQNWVFCFFGSGPAERSRRPTGRNQKKKLCTLGDDSRQQTKILETTNDTGHEQKRAKKGQQKKKHTLAGPCKR